MDKAPDFGSGDCRIESCHARNFLKKVLVKYSPYYILLYYLSLPK